MRAAIFIDGAYLLRQFHDARITPDYARFADYLLAPLRRNAQIDLLRCYFYYCPPWMSEKPTEDELRRMAVHERFVAELQQNCDRWQVRLGKLEKRRDGEREVFAQKRVDVQLSVDLVHHASAGHIQHAVLCAGDSDFIPAIIAAKSSGATFTLWCGRDRSVHKDLIINADEVHYFDWRHVPKKAPEKSQPQPQAQPQAQPQPQPQPQPQAEQTHKKSPEPPQSLAESLPVAEQGEELKQEAEIKPQAVRRGQQQRQGTAQRQAPRRRPPRDHRPLAVTESEPVLAVADHDETAGDNIGNLKTAEEQGAAQPQRPYSRRRRRPRRPPES